MSIRRLSFRRPPSLKAEDGYRVAFSLAELDSGILDSGVLVADTMDGAPIPPKLGPFRLVVPHDKSPARWVRMLKSITVVTPQKLSRRAPIEWPGGPWAG